MILLLTLLGPRVSDVFGLTGDDKTQVWIDLLDAETPMPFHEMSAGEGRLVLDFGGLKCLAASGHMQSKLVFWVLEDAYA